MNTIKVIISSRSVILVLAFLILAWIVYQSLNIILLLFASFVIASALFPVVDWMDKKIPRGLAVLLVYIAGFLILATVLIPFFSVLTEQIQEFVERIPVYSGEVYTYITDLEAKTGIIIPDISEIVSPLTNVGQNIVSQGINITINVVTGIVAVFTMAIIVFFILLDKEELKKGFLRFFPEDMRDKTASITKTISRKVGGYVRGQLLIMLAVGILTTLGLSIIGVDFAILLGLLAAILEIVPIIGPVLSAVPAVIVALAQDPILAVWAIVVYLIVQRIENSFLAPLILGKFLDMHPLIIIAALLIAASTLGIIGVILSPAIAAAIYVLVQELYLNRVNPKS
ncbi:MAG: hypothetical protein A2287_00265 [Candidatus Melainabacteria bacterium RIFOXYA12_FULL_32_12]|nr:MAG: hypothetical protein A2255_07905 [Candidatus Melainabacteria bacterium RIFOXYA2_FULL_32_9]OGI25647.1 MAG: hypothetical protein A2287_00265 [Candidatus Melainabacteria bacterium RIFOXYA12_FULL_32_12]